MELLFPSNIGFGIRRMDVHVILGFVIVSRVTIRLSDVRVNTNLRWEIGRGEAPSWFRFVPCNPLISDIVYVHVCIDSVGTKSKSKSKSHESKMYTINWLFWSSFFHGIKMRVRNIEDGRIVSVVYIYLFARMRFQWAPSIVDRHAIQDGKESEGFG